MRADGGESQRTNQRIAGVKKLHGLPMASRSSFSSRRKNRAEEKKGKDKDDAHVGTKR